MTSQKRLRDEIDALSFSMTSHRARGAYIQICPYFHRGEVQEPEKHAAHGQAYLTLGDEDTLCGEKQEALLRLTGERRLGTPETSWMHAANTYLIGLEGWLPNFIRDGEFLADTDHSREISIVELAAKAVVMSHFIPPSAAHPSSDTYRMKTKAPQRLKQIVDGLAAQLTANGDAASLQSMEMILQREYGPARYRRRAV